MHPGPGEIEELEDEDELQNICLDIGKQIYGTDPNYYMEPFFEREPTAELGFCMEGHVSAASL